MSNENTPVPSAASDKADKPTPAFSERDVRLIVAAMQSLSGGPPEIDFDKFTDHGGFNTKKTAMNTWGTLKKKIAEVNPGAMIGTPQKKKKADGPKTPTSKKRTKKEANDEEGDAVEGTPAKKPRTLKKENESSEEAGDGSPKQKKKTPAKKTPVTNGAAKKSAASIKDEEKENEDSTAAPAETEEAKQSVEGAEKDKTPSAAAGEDTKMEEATGGD